MHSKITYDHNDNDHHADDVKDVHCFAPIERTSGVQRPRLLLYDRSDNDIGLSKSAHRSATRRAGLSSQSPCLGLSRTLYIIAYAA
jgi:hypothetical protein